jgi:hypothetical protein
MEEDNAHLVVLPHLASHKVPVLQLVDEPVTRAVDEQTADTPQRLGGEELDLEGVVSRVGRSLIRVELNPRHTLALGSLGSTRPVGCTWTFSMSIPFAPTSMAILWPSPVQWSPLVVGWWRISR